MDPRRRRHRTTRELRSEVAVGLGRPDPYGREAARTAVNLLRQGSARTTPAPAPAIRRVSYSETYDRYYSDADESLTIDETHAAITAATTSSGKSGGHAIIYLEMMRKLDDDRYEAHTYMIDLAVDPLRINIHFAHHDARLAEWLYPGSPLDRFRRLRPERSRTWPISGAGALAGYQKARAVKNEIDDYRYAYLGRSPDPSHKYMNCARFAEKILKAAGVAVGEASSGSVFKIPSKLVAE